jgi:glycosyltransferase involved in cell wall biosynthesis
MSQKLEQSALEQATLIVTISSALRDDLIKRGIEENKIFEVPNGVDTDYFQPSEPDAELTATNNLGGKTVIGFIGSFYFYEGLEHLIDAMLLLLEERQDVTMLLVGEGEAEETLRERIPVNLRNYFIFAGKVPHYEVRRYYSVMDILVYPRVKSRLTELTTPLKPLEAMAMERVVVGSDVGGIRELVKHGRTGFLVEPENPRELAACLVKLAGDAALRYTVGEEARRAVAHERQWKRIVERYFEIYKIAVSR